MPDISPQGKTCALLYIIIIIIVIIIIIIIIIITDNHLYSCSNKTHKGMDGGGGGV